MPKAVQFTVALDNTAGTLALLCSRLRKAGVNLDAISVSDNTDCGWVRLIASPAAKARAALERAGYTVCARQVVTAMVTDRPGELERLATRLAKAGVNVNYVYGSAPGAKGASSMLVFGVSDVAKATKALG